MFFFCVFLVIVLATSSCSTAFQKKKLLATASCVQQKHVFHAAKPIIYSCAKAGACIQHIVLPLKHFPILFPYRLSTQCFSKASVVVQLYVAPMAAASTWCFQNSQCFPNAHMCTTWHARKLFI